MLFRIGLHRIRTQSIEYIVVEYCDHLYLNPLVKVLKWNEKKNKSLLTFHTAFETALYIQHVVIALFYDYY